MLNIKSPIEKISLNLCSYIKVKKNLVLGSNWSISPNLIKDHDELYA